MNSKGQLPQEQKPPGTEQKMDPKPKSENPNYKSAKRFEEKLF